MTAEGVHVQRETRQGSCAFEPGAQDKWSGLVQGQKCNSRTGNWEEGRERGNAYFYILVLYLFLQ